MFVFSSFVINADPERHSITNWQRQRILRLGQKCCPAGSLHQDSSLKLFSCWLTADQDYLGSLIAQTAEKEIACPCNQLNELLKKPNPSKGGDGKPRILASSEKSWKSSRRTQDRRAADTASTEQVAGGAMNTLRFSTFSLTLAIGVFVLGHANPSLAAPSCLKNPDHPNCIEPDDGESLKAKFDLTIELTVPQSISYDTGSYHHSGKDHVQISSSGPGFRFDTNGQNTSKLSRWMSARWVYMTVTGQLDDRKDYEIDFRFNQTNGLDLGLLGVGSSDTVAASLQYYGGQLVTGFKADNYGILGFGALNAPNPNETCLTSDEGAGMIKVTRNTIDTWTLESNTKGKACRFAKDANGNICTTAGSCNVKPELIDFKFKFIIVQQ